MADDRVRDVRRALLQIYQRAIDEVNGARVVERELRAHPPRSEVSMIALGKAACAMARGAAAALGSQIADGLVVTTAGAFESLPWPVREASHPVPDESSLHAGQAIGNFITRIPVQREVLVLLSGGASSLAEQLQEGVSLADLQQTNRWLLGSGLDIHHVNAIRRRLSRFKGGGLARQLYPRPVRALAISDVPGDRPESIGSGPLSRTNDVIDIDGLPEFLRQLLASRPRAPDAGPWPEIRYDIVATNRDARTAAAGAVAANGWVVSMHDDPLTGDATATGIRLAQSVLEGPPGVIHLWGGETTVRLPAQPGRGGRCQQLALSAACILDGHPRVFLLAASTDGRDGPGDDAGALVDGDTLPRARVEGHDVENALQRADAGTVLETSGDLVATGPTGTNVMDLVLGLRL